MKKVNYKKWIEAVYLKDGHSATLKEGTNCWEKEFNNVGFFHQWGQSYEEFESGPVNYTVGIVQTENGTIEEILPINLKFEDSCKQGCEDLVEALSYVLASTSWVRIGSEALENAKVVLKKYDI